MSQEYDFASIEAAAQAQWAANNAFAAVEDPNREKFYCLSMLPYPSGALHMGHVRNYTIGDVVSRYQRMLGKNVLQPMGFDAFGLPAENAAIKHKMAAATWTYSNIEYMRTQLKALGLAYDWSREVITCKPDYYRHEQALFVDLYAKGLVYKKTSLVNWDPIEQTVLANEQVSPDGRGWRSGAMVEKREIPQWFFRTTAYADELLRGLDNLPGWPDSVKAQQRHWIGRSEGLEIDFAVDLADAAALTVYTTRPDTLCGVTFLSVAVEHPLARACAARDPELAAALQTLGTGKMAEAEIEKGEKLGVALGIDAIHPLTGARVPIWAANFVLMGYGTGAVMAVPGHDQRDYEMARKYSLPIVQVIDAPAGVEPRPDVGTEAYLPHGVCINSGALDGLDYEAAFAAVERQLGAKGAARKRVNFRLRDWGVSRQRFWGCPIPMLYDAQGNAVPVPRDELPVVLPENAAFTGVRSPIKEDPEFARYAGSAGTGLTRDTDTFDTFVESSWYYARYCCPGANDMVDARAHYWLPIDLYIGGIEHATMHLLYFRFWHKLMRDAGLVHSDEPATRLLCQGMVIADTYYRESADGQRSYFNPTEVDIQRDAKGRALSAVLRSDGQPVVIGAIEKMSKSKNNGVDPQSMIDRYGADTVRLFSMFAAPPDAALEWSEAGVEGCHRFLKRVYRGVTEHLTAGVPTQPLDIATLSATARELRTLLHETIDKVGRDVGERLQFNTAIAAIMEYINALLRFDEQDDNARALRQEAWTAIVLMLQPITPHISAALWAALGESRNVLDVGYPTPEPAALLRDQIVYVVQVNGKLRGQVCVPRDADKASIEAAALAEPNVQRFMAGAALKRVIVVPGKLVNVVV